MSREDEILAHVKDRYGAVLDLNERPGDLIDILRRFNLDDPSDGGSAPGGAPDPPSGPSARREEPTNGELMREILKLSRQVALLTRQ